MQNSNKEPLGKYLSIGYRALCSLLDKKLADYDIGRGQHPFLIALYHQEGLCQQDLCSIYRLDKAVAGRALKKLEEKDFVVRKKDSEDRRRYLIYLTKKGRELRPSFIDILQSTEEEMKKGLTEKEVDLFLKVIKKICNNLTNQEEEK